MNFSKHLVPKRPWKRHSVVWVYDRVGVPVFCLGHAIRVQGHDVKSIHHARIIPDAYELPVRNVAHRFHAVKISVIHAQRPGMICGTAHSRVHFDKTSANQPLYASYEIRLNQMRVNPLLQILLGSTAFDPVMFANFLKFRHLVLDLHKLAMFCKFRNVQ